MERLTLNFSLPNFITIGLIGAVWYIILVGGWTLITGTKPKLLSKGA